jgi:electron transfer flavoprotein alpha subunit
MTAPDFPESVSGVMTRRRLPPAAAASPVRHISTVPVPVAASISDAEILVAGGRGLTKPSDLDMVRTLASLLGGEWATSRPLAEKGWGPSARQIGLSGRTVRPKLIIAAGISGAIQFTACMNASERIVAINADPDAPIFKIAHVAVIGDLYTILPELIGSLQKEKRDGAV